MVNDNGITSTPKVLTEEELYKRLKATVDDLELFPVPGDENSKDLEGEALADYKQDCIKVFELLWKLGVDGWNDLFYPAEQFTKQARLAELFKIGDGFLDSPHMRSFVNGLDHVRKQPDLDQNSRDFVMLLFGILAAASSEDDQDWADECKEKKASENK
jgi:hypothetical protein